MKLILIAYDISSFKLSTSSHAMMNGSLCTFLQAAGVRLKELIGDETVSFYVSPFVRSKETYTSIKEHFSEDQV